MSMEETFKQILSFQITSALECAGEPNAYGAVRLLESAQQLIEFGLLHGISSDTRLRKIAEQIGREKGTALTDRERFFKMTEELSLAMVDLV